MRIATFTSDNLDSVLKLLQKELPVERLSEADFARKVLLDTNFDPSGAYLATDEKGAAIGFALSIKRKRPLEDGVPDLERGWITLFAVESSMQRQGIGTALFDMAEEWLLAHGCSSVWISPYAPNYWTPGVDAAVNPAALSFLSQRGYRTAVRPLAMEALLAENWTIPPSVSSRMARLHSAGLEILPFETSSILPLTDFMTREFPGDWQRYLRETMLDMVAGRRPPKELLLAFDRGILVGFAQSEAERFGPVGVAAAERGRGVGAVLLYQSLARMKARGHTRAWFMWTNDETADRLYSPAGFTVTRRFEVMTKQFANI